MISVNADIEFPRLEFGSAYAFLYRHTFVVYISSFYEVCYVSVWHISNPLLRFALRFADCLSYFFPSLPIMWRRIDAIRPSFWLRIWAQGRSGVGLPPCLSAFANIPCQQLPTTPVAISLQSENCPHLRLVRHP